MRKVILANSKSAKKRILVAERRRQSNRPFRSAARTYVKKAEMAIHDGDQAVALEAVNQALSTLDRVASKGVIHRNNAARRKSRLMKKFHVLGASA
jgi:small subunit ribosomal protein S20